MPRLSIKEQRAKEIISAFERCIARNGIAGAQLEKIADESGIQRPALRHFIGNRDQLILALTKSIADEYQQMMITAGKLLDKMGKQPEDLLVVLFMQTRLTTPERIIVIVNLYSIASRYPKVQKELSDWYLSFVKWIASRLAEYKPKASKQDLERVAIALVSMSFNFASLAPLGINNRDYDHILEAATKLVNTIKG